MIDVKLELTIDGKQAQVDPGATVLEAARQVGVEIPVLCHDDRVDPAGCCRMCLVEIEGQRRLQPACTFPASAGMQVRSDTERVDRHLSNCGEVLVRGRRARVLGRICMNLTIIDITDIEGVQTDDEVVLIGRQGSNYLSAAEMAAKIGTIHYEVVTRIPSTVPRVYTG